MLKNISDLREALSYSGRTLIDKSIQGKLYHSKNEIIELCLTFLLLYSN